MSMKKMTFFLSLLSVTSRLQTSVAWSSVQRRLVATTNNIHSNIRNGGYDLQCDSRVRPSSSVVSRQPTTIYSTKMGRHRRRLSPYSVSLLFSSTALAVAGGFSTLAYCSAEDDQAEEEDELQVPPFDETSMTFDHYNGVTLHLDKLAKRYTSSTSPSASSITTSSTRISSSSEEKENEIPSFETELEQALTFWKAEGRRGIWIHVPPHMSHLVPDCMNLGFSFHFVKEKTLILSLWLPEDAPSRLPLGPTHQVGVGTVVLHPSDPSQMLVVQELTGPAAARKVWKMPTGLLDPGEDIPEAAARELKEETGLDGTVDGIVCFRQAHSEARSSDLFFVCRMKLLHNKNNYGENNENDKDNDNGGVNKESKIIFKPQEEEIADIRWMSVEEYCNQEQWQISPVYKTLNDAIRKASARAIEAHKEASSSSSSSSTKSVPPCGVDDAIRNNELSAKEGHGMIVHKRLPLGFADGTNALYLSHTVN